MQQQEQQRSKNSSGLPPTPVALASKTAASPVGVSIPQQQQDLHNQQRSQRIQQQLANYRPKRRRSKPEPPMVPGPAFAAGVALTGSACLLVVGGAVCFAKKCNNDTSLGVALLVLAGLSLFTAVALFASLPCCYCDESHNCRVRVTCSLRCQRMRQRRRGRRDSRVHASPAAAPNQPGSGKIGLPAITVRDYSTVASPTATATTGGSPLSGSPTVSFSDELASAGFDSFSIGGSGSGGSSRRNSLPPQLAWCYEGEPPDPSRLHPMYGRRRDSWAGAGLTVADSGDGRLRK